MADRPELSVLELTQLSDGEPHDTAIPTTLDLARRAEEWGYRGFWLAEHHLSPGVASSAPPVLAALVAAATTRLRVGSAATLLAVTSPAVAVEQFATLARAVGDRVDLGLGRVHSPRPGLPEELVAGLRATTEALGVHRGDASLREDLRVTLDLLGGKLVDELGLDHASPLVAGAPVTPHVLASSPGESAQLAGELGLPLVANHHVAPTTARETVAAYRAAFRPGVLREPRVAISADVLVAETEERAAELATPFAPWVLAIRRTGRAIPVPSPEEVAAFPDDEATRELLADRLAGRFVGTAEQVRDRLAELAEDTGAVEILVTTTTYRHADRFRSFELLSRAWAS